MASSEAITLTDAELEAAREWIGDCEWRDLEPEDVDELTAAEVTRAVARHYDGGLAAFIVASGLRGEAYECPSCHAAPGEPCRVEPGYVHVVRDRLAHPAQWAQVGKVATVSAGWTVGS